MFTIYVLRKSHGPDSGRLMVSLQQIRDLKTISDERQQAIDLSEAKTRFLASMSHEIRTPINAVLGMNEMILRENRDPVIGEYADSVKSSGQMLLMLVNDVLDFSKIEAGRTEVNPQEYDPYKILRDVYYFFAQAAQKKDLYIHIICDETLPSSLYHSDCRQRWAP